MFGVILWDRVYLIKDNVLFTSFLAIFMGITSKIGVLKRGLICQHRHDTQQQFIYRYHILLVSGQVNPKFDRC